MSVTALVFCAQTSQITVGERASTPAPPDSTASSAPSTSTFSTSGAGNRAASQSSVTVGTSCVDRTPPAMALPKPARWLVARLRRAT